MDADHKTNLLGFNTTHLQDACDEKPNFRKCKPYSNGLIAQNEPFKLHY